MAMLPLTVAAQAHPITSTVTGTVTDVAGTTTLGTFAGTFRLLNFAVSNGQVVANGLVSGTLTGTGGNVLGTITNVPVALPVSASGTCQILTLTLGPLHLDVLGLVVDLNQVVLTITAQQGPGNLLGNLL
jgi:hypothetical protein